MNQAVFIVFTLIPIVFSSSFDQFKGRFMDGAGNAASPSCSICQQQCVDLTNALPAFMARPEVIKVFKYYAQSENWYANQNSYYIYYNLSQTYVDDINASIQSFSGKPLVNSVKVALGDYIQRMGNRYEQYESLREKRLNNYQLSMPHDKLITLVNEYSEGFYFLSLFENNLHLGQMKKLCGLDPCSSLKEIAGLYKNGHVADLPFTMPPDENYGTQLYGDFIVNQWTPLSLIKTSFTDPLMDILIETHQACANQRCYNLTGFQIISSKDVGVQITFKDVTKQIGDIISKNLNNAQQTLKKILAIPIKSSNNAIWYMPTNVHEWPSITTPTFTKMQKCYDILNSQLTP